MAISRADARRRPSHRNASTMLAPRANKTHRAYAWPGSVIAQRFEDMAN